MAQFTVISKKKVYRVEATNLQLLQKALRAAGIVWQGIHEDKEPTLEALKEHFA